MPNEYQSIPLPFSEERIGISKKTLEIHHDKLYSGYVAKMNEVSAKLAALRDNADAQAASNQTYSELRALRSGETFATNGVYLHEDYFECLAGPSTALETEIAKAISAKWGSLEKFIAYFSASGIAMRGWVVLCWNTKTKELNIYGCDSHDQGGVWGCIPLIVLDVYEHAYFIDYGSDRKKYIADFWKNLDWKTVDDKFRLYSNH